MAMRQMSLFNLLTGVCSECVCIWMCILIGRHPGPMGISRSMVLLPGGRNAWEVFQIYDTPSGSLTDGLEAQMVETHVFPPNRQRTPSGCQTPVKAEGPLWGTDWATGVLSEFEQRNSPTG